MPLVLLVDEIDSPAGDTLLSVLRQLRTGYHYRSEGFQESVGLCGVDTDVTGERDVCWGVLRQQGRAGASKMTTYTQRGRN